MIVSLGRVNVDTPGTLVRATNNESDPTSAYLCHSCMIRVDPNNTGYIYICDRSNADVDTGGGVICVLGVPTVNSIPSFTDTVTNAIAAINLERVWIDAELADNGVIVSADIS